ncbi:40S ribosomal protein S29 [Acorus gramineus]|uniref:40S ribosomal protein S29 n=1 Tax=Acorus gramineus TaxID=55184 RepID=A0AAV9A723_ACOGR|nr:40S ribosomal protein S29 [Acorus gramineus]
MSGNSHGLGKKYGPLCCRWCFRSNVKKIGLMKVNSSCLKSNLKDKTIPFLQSTDKQ